VLDEVQKLGDAQELAQCLSCSPQLIRSYAVLSIARMNSTGYALILMIDEDDGSQEWA
jgi:hypothetical protein